MTGRAPSVVGSRSLARDPRADRRVVAALARVGLDAPVAGPPAAAVASHALRLRLCDASERRLGAALDALLGAGAPTSGIRRERIDVPGPRGPIPLRVHRPAGSSGTLPCVVQLHGGAMAMLSADHPTYARWRDDLAARGVVVVGVEFRNAAGALGPHPYPAGLEDCAAAVRWLAGNRAALDLSGIVVSGDSGGGNLALAVAILARRQGWVGEIAGCHAQCPYLSGLWADPPADLPSIVALDGVFASRALYAVLAEVYDPGGVHADDPTCWPLRARDTDLEGLPPHVISVNELDLLRDEGTAYGERLRAAGVPVAHRVIPGVTHVAEILLPEAVPDVRRAVLDDVVGLATTTTAGEER